MPEMTISFLGTGSGTSTNSAHTAIVYDCNDGTRLLVDANSGNSASVPDLNWESQLRELPPFCCRITTLTTCRVWSMFNKSERRHGQMPRLWMFNSPKNT